MADSKDIIIVFSEADKAFGKIDILINNAGVYEFLPIEEVNSEHYHKIFDLNVLGLLLAIKEATKYFDKGGNIVNISSIVSESPQPQGPVYSASKAAVDAITKSLGKELGPRNIWINSVNPGMVETEGLHAAGLSEKN